MWLLQKDPTLFSKLQKQYFICTDRWSYRLSMVVQTRCSSMRKLVNCDEIAEIVQRWFSSPYTIILEINKWSNLGQLTSIIKVFIILNTCTLYLINLKIKFSSLFMIRSFLQLYLIIDSNLSSITDYMYKCCIDWMFDGC